jgi:hypothetical protein
VVFGEEDTKKTTKRRAQAKEDADTAEAGDPSGGVALVVEQLETAGGRVKLESLREHENAAVYQKANWLLETYFAETDEPTSLPTATADGYSFGVPAALPALHFGR